MARALWQAFAHPRFSSTSSTHASNRPLLSEYPWSGQIPLIGPFSGARKRFISNL